MPNRLKAKGCARWSAFYNIECIAGLQLTIQITRAEFGIAPELWIGLPQLDHDLLEQVVPIGMVISIDAADLVKQRFVPGQFFFKFLFVSLQLIV